MRPQGLRGNYYDRVSQTNFPVQGSVDKKTQRAAWSVGGNKKLVVETGLYNLTQDESTALVHSGPDQAHQCVLVRMKQPAQDQPQQCPSTSSRLRTRVAELVRVRQSRKSHDFRYPRIKP